ncbi:MAG: AmmeMemoRadiSam system protein A, partial [Erysipelotrichaceae bacterium]|nr:AmmeMemoRadiSam system protein A [Erysipelotrichaceae bacterium]
MIVGAVMVPHPPLIVAEIGQGREQVVGQTIDAYHQAAKTLASWNPDTLIVISPHATMYKDYFQIAPGDRATGDFSAFQ